MVKSTVKICGLQSVEVLANMLKLPIDHIGFVFAKSKRQVSPQQAGEMIAYLSEHAKQTPLTAGVFVNPTKQELEEIVMVAPLDIIQLHGEESPELCQWVKTHLQRKVFKVFSIAEEKNEESVRKQLMPYTGVIDALMLDTFDPIIGGGTGKTFNWQTIPMYRKWAKEQRIPLIAAGGLHADNVQQLIHEYQPDGVDVSSGVETDGVKDINKIVAFVERVKHI